MLMWATFDQNSVIVRVKILDSTVSTGAGKTGLTSASTGLIISTIADSEATATAYTVAGSTIETITTLGTYAAPTATKCRFKEVDATNHPGIYELQFADARFSIASAKSLLISILGATGAAQCDAVIPLPTVNLFDAVRAGLTALPNAAADAAGGLPISDAGGLDLDAQRADVAAILVDTGTTLQGEVDGIQADTEDIQSRLPAALTANGNMKSSLMEILATALTETAGLLAGAFKKFFNVATPTGTVNSLPDAVAGAAGGVFIAGTNAATSVTTALTANITGNLSGSVGSVTGAVGSVTGAVGSLGAQAKLDVNAEVVDALNVDTYAEPGQAAPPATASLATKQGYLYKAWRNKSTQTATEYDLFADDGTTVDQKATTSDDGTTFTKGEVGTGP